MALLLSASPAQAQVGVDRPGSDLKPGFDLPKADPELCKKACNEDGKCKAYTYVKPGFQGPNARCWLKSAVTPAIKNDCCTSGLREETVIQVLPLPTGVRSIAGFEIGFDRTGSDYRDFEMADPRPDLCRDACEGDPNCRAFTFVRGGSSPGPAHCWLKNSVPPAKPEARCISGTPRPAAPNVRATRRLATAALLAQAPSPAARIDWKRHIRERFANLNADLRQAQREEFTKSIARARTLNDQVVLKAAANPEHVGLLIKGVPVSEGQPPFAQKKAASVTRRPVVNQILSVSSQAAPGVIESPGYVFVVGRNFGASPGTLRLTYTTSREFTPLAPHTVDLQPLFDSWDQSWSDSLIAARVPVLTEPFAREREAGIPGSVITKDPRPQLSVSVGAGPVGTTGVPADVNLRGAGFRFIQTAPAWADREHVNAIVAGGVVTVYGMGFGTTKGVAWIDLQDPITPFNGPPARRVPFEVKGWSDTKIELRVPDLQGDYPFVPGMFWVRPNETPPAAQGMVFGPRMEVSLIGGEQYFEPDIEAGDPADKWTTEGAVMTVVHDPGCVSIFSSGNDGNDWFFRERRLPSTAKLLKAMVYRQSPGDDAALQSEWFGNQMKELAKNFWSGIGEMSVMALGMMFNPKWGSYEMQVGREPTADEPTFSVHWENTCAGIYKGKPLVYTTSFMILAPEGVVK